MATFNPGLPFSTISLPLGTYFSQAGHYFDSKFNDVGTTLPVQARSMSVENSGNVSILGGSIDGVTIGSGSTINAPISGSVTNATISGSTITGGSINGTPIGQTTPAAGAFTGLNATSANVLGALAAEGISSTSNGNPASTANTGVALSQTFAEVLFYDSTQSANNRTSDVLWSGGSLSFRMKNDAGSSATPWLTATGGQASGITGITSSSGSGAWAHTGQLSATSDISSAGNLYATVASGNNVVLTGSASGGTPAISTSGANVNVSLNVNTKGSGGINLNAATAVTGTLSATGAINSSVGLTVKEGSNAKQGVATLGAGGTVTVANTSVTANSRIFLTSQADGGTVGFLRVSARVAGTSFTITSSSTTDTSTVAYEIFEPGS